MAPRDPCLHPVIQDKTLWFLAILPPQEVCDRVRAVQREIAERFGPKRILKVPVHITLEPPFRLDEEDASRMVGHLSEFMSAQRGFSVELRNFGTFRSSVVFIEVTANLQLFDLHQNISALLRHDHAYIHGKAWQQGYTPHVTVANRDVTPAVHHAIWSEFNTRKFFARFTVDAVALLRHDGNVWHTQQLFPLLSPPA